MENLAQLSDLTNVYYWHGFAVFLRVGAVVSLLPAFGEESVPMRVKLAVTIAFTMIVAAGVPVSSIPSGLGAVLTTALSETISGLLIGVGIRLFVLALQTAGAIAAQSTSLSQLLGGAAIEPLAAIGYVLTIAGLALAVMMGLHVKAAELMILSYDILPSNMFIGGSDVAEWGVAQVKRAFELAFTLGAPFILLSVLYNLTLGAINKAMPQLMVAFVGAPVITAGGLFLLCVASPLMLKVWLDALDSFMANPFVLLP
ncbi:flagellar biosynthetic protein FliR [Pseudosulfitobacter sp. SM2401]|uniref:flagellar biosynthetic protein FliR n=1 Tax=Pseudosulfitobacter sp. SM2401 TaxID=3350098 RepID=UPI0036F284FD